MCYITKYGTKFQLDSKHILKWIEINFLLGNFSNNEINEVNKSDNLYY